MTGVTTEDAGDQEPSLGALWLLCSDSQKTGGWHLDKAGLTGGQEPTGGQGTSPVQGERVPAPEELYLAFWPPWCSRYLVAELSSGDLHPGGCAPGGAEWTGVPRVVKYPRSAHVSQAPLRTPSWRQPHLIGLRRQPHHGTRVTFGRVHTEHNLEGRDEG